MRLLSLCSGYGGLDLAVEAVTGAHTVAYAEIEDAPAQVFARHWPDARPLGDLTTVDWTTVDADVVCAGFPCQDLSYAGKGRGIVADSRSGLWYAIEHALGVVRPRLVVLENVGAIVARRPGLDVVLAGLAGLGFDAQWACVRASDVGAPHRRERWFLVAHAGHDARGAQQPLQHAIEAARPGQPDQGPAADACGERHGGGQDRREVGRLDRPDAGEARQRERARKESGDRGAAAAANSDGDGLEGVGRDAPLGRDAHRCDGAREAASWGDYGPAVRRWERTVGRAAPAPTDDRGRLSPRFVEWMMGLPDGWVTDTPGLSRSKQLKCLGNGVVPQQAAHALTGLLERAATERIAA